MLFWQSRPRQRRPTRDGGAVHIQHHGHQHVIAIGGDQVHHALLAKAAEHPVVSRIADPRGAVQFVAKVVNRGFFGAHGRGALALGNGGGDGWFQTGLQSQAVVGVPLILRGPLAGGDQNGQLGEFGTQGAFEADVRAHFLQMVAQLRAAQEHIERAAQGGVGADGGRTGHRRARARTDGRCEFALRGCHGLVVQQRKTPPIAVCCG